MESPLLVSKVILSPEFYLACNAKLKELLTKEARQLPDKYGVEAILHNGEILYPYNAACKKLGNVKYPKAAERKMRHPQHFKMIYGRNFVTPLYLELLHSYYHYKNSVKQLKIPFE